MSSFAEVLIALTDAELTDTEDRRRRETQPQTQPVQNDENFDGAEDAANDYDEDEEEVRASSHHPPRCATPANNLLAGAPFHRAPAAAQCLHACGTGGGGAAQAARRSTRHAGAGPRRDARALIAGAAADGRAATGLLISSTVRGGAPPGARAPPARAAGAPRCDSGATACWLTARVAQAFLEFVAARFEVRSAAPPRAERGEAAVAATAQQHRSQGSQLSMPACCCRSGYIVYSEPPVVRQPATGHA